MKYSELKRSLNYGVEPIYITYGSDDFLRNYAVTLIKEKYIAMPDLNYIVFEGVNVTHDTLEAIFNSLHSFPFLSEKRMIVMKEYYPSSDEFKKSGMLDYFKNPNSSSILIINNKKECKAFDKTETVKINCNSDMPLCVGWICNEAKKSGVGIGPDIAGKIAEFCLLDFTKINSEINKLFDYCKADGKVSFAAVKEIVHKDSEYQVYEMVECITSAKYDEAYAILYDLLSKNESEQKLFISIYTHFRRMLHISLSNATNAELAETLGVKEYSIKMTKMQIRRFSVKKIKEICEKFSMYDTQFKSGETGLGDVLWKGVFAAMIK